MAGQQITLEDLVKALHNEKAKKPDMYNGDTSPRLFIEDCELYFKDSNAYNLVDNQNNIIPGAVGKQIRFIFPLLKDRPKEWVRLKNRAYAATTPTVYPAWDDFKKEFIKAFQIVDEAIEARVRLDTIKQKQFPSVNAYNMAYNTLLDQGSINATDKEALQYYLKGLNYNIAEKLYTRERPPAGLAAWQEAAATLDGGLQSFARYLKGPSTSSGYKAHTAGRGSNRIDEPMDIDAIEQQGSNNRRCYTCNSKFHLARNCPHKDRATPNPNRNYQNFRGGRGGGRGGNQNNFQPRNQQGQFQRPNSGNNRSNIRAAETDQNNNDDFDKNIREAIVRMIEAGNFNDIEIPLKEEDTNNNEPQDF